LGGLQNNNNFNEVKQLHELSLLYPCAATRQRFHNQPPYIKLSKTFDLTTITYWDGSKLKLYKGRPFCIQLVDQELLVYLKPNDIPNSDYTVASGQNKLNTVWDESEYLHCIVDSPYVYPNLELYGLADLQPSDYSTQEDRDQYQLIVSSRIPKLHEQSPKVTTQDPISQPMDTSAPTEVQETNPTSPPPTTENPNPLHNFLVTMTPTDLNLRPVSRSRHHLPRPLSHHLSARLP